MEKCKLHGHIANYKPLFSRLLLIAVLTITAPELPFSQTLPQQVDTNCSATDCIPSTVLMDKEDALHFGDALKSNAIKVTVIKFLNNYLVIFKADDEAQYQQATEIMAQTYQTKTRRGETTPLSMYQIRIKGDRVN